jgi:hypothetical protein
MVHLCQCVDTIGNANDKVVNQIILALNRDNVIPISGNDVHTGGHTAMLGICDSLGCFGSRVMEMDADLVGVGVWEALKWGLLPVDDDDEKAQLKVGIVHNAAFCGVPKGRVGAMRMDEPLLHCCNDVFTLVDVLGQETSCFGKCWKMIQAATPRKSGCTCIQCTPRWLTSLNRQQCRFLVGHWHLLQKGHHPRCWVVSGHESELWPRW